MAQDLDAPAPTISAVTPTGEGRVDVRGEAEESTDGTLVFLYEHRGERGYFTQVDGDGAFEIRDVDVDLDDNCLQLYAENPGAETASLDAFYVLSITEQAPGITWARQDSGACAAAGE